MMKYLDVATIQQLILKCDVCKNKLEYQLNIFSVLDWMYGMCCKNCGYMKIDEICSHNIATYPASSHKNTTSLVLGCCLYEDCSMAS